MEKIWKKKKNLAIALNVFYVKKEKIYLTNVSKHNSNRKKQVILLMVPNGERRESKPKGRWHYLAVKELLALKNDGYLYCLNCLHSLRTKDKLESHKRLCENNDFWDF